VEYEEILASKRSFPEKVKEIMISEARNLNVQIKMLPLLKYIFGKKVL
jgi:hypothetical protein